MMLTAADLKHRWALTSDGRVVPVKMLIDESGDETNDPAMAVVFTAGEGFDYAPFLVSEIPARTNH